MSGGFVDGGPVSLIAGSSDLAIARRVKLSSGLLVYAGALDSAIGITMLAALAGEPCTVRPWNHDSVVEVTAAGAFSAGAILYPAASGKLDDVATGGGERYIAIEAATADGDRVQAYRLSAGALASELIANSVADSSTITNTTVETDFDVTKVVDASVLKAGDELEVEALVKFPSTNSTDTANIKLKAGAVTLVACGATNVANDDYCLIRGKVAITVAGASGFLKGHGDVAIGQSGAAAPVVWAKDVSAQDLSATLTIKASCTWSVANAGNQAILKTLRIVHHKK